MKTFFFILTFLLLSQMLLGNTIAEEKNKFKQQRLKMVEQQIAERGVTDRKVLNVMKKVKRHLFVSPELKYLAYEDRPLPIGQGQTISQPFIVAFMTEALNLRPNDRVLEIGTGSGYQAAVLAELVEQVYTIEIVPELAQQAKERLLKLGYKNIDVKEGDGYKGWPENAPFDVIIITAAPPFIPEELVNQLKIGGEMIVPVGTYYQELILLKKTKDGVQKQKLIPVRFVPMVK